MSEDVAKKTRNVFSFWGVDKSRVETLERLWMEGKSASEISNTFRGEVSRNAVIGKANRLGLQRSTEAHKTSMSLGHRNIGVRAQAKVFGETRVPKAPPVARAPNQNAWLNFGTKKAPKLVVSANSAVFEQTDAEPTLPPVNVRAWAPLPRCAPVTLMDLEASHCKWPIDITGATEAHFCARKRDGAGPYCGVHTALAQPKAGAKEHLDRKLGLAPRIRAA